MLRRQLEIHAPSAAANELAFAPNGRQPRLLVRRQSRWAVVMAYLYKPG